MPGPWSQALLQSPTAALLAAARPAAAALSQASDAAPYGNGTLPADIRSRLISGVNGITMHVLEAGFDPNGRPGVLLVHGFPELAYSWRKVMLPLAAAGYHVMAPDQRGYGRSGGADVAYDEDLAPFSTLNRVRDMLALTSALGHRTVAAVVRHDWLAGGRVVRADAARRLQVGRDDERAFRSARSCRSTRRTSRCVPVRRREHGRRPRGPHTAAEALPDLLHDA
jgi:hypothetical protein